MDYPPWDGFRDESHGRIPYRNGMNPERKVFNPSLLRRPGVRDTPDLIRRDYIAPIYVGDEYLFISHPLLLSDRPISSDDAHQLLTEMVWQFIGDYGTLPQTNPCDHNTLRFETMRACWFILQDVFGEPFWITVHEDGVKFYAYPGGSPSGVSGSSRGHNDSRLDTDTGLDFGGFGTERGDGRPRRGVINRGVGVQRRGPANLSLQSVDMNAFSRQFGSDDASSTQAGFHQHDDVNSEFAGFGDDHSARTPDNNYYGASQRSNGPGNFQGQGRNTPNMAGSAGVAPPGYSQGKNPRGEPSFSPGGFGSHCGGFASRGGFGGNSQGQERNTPNKTEPSGSVPPGYHQTNNASFGGFGSPRGDFGSSRRGTNSSRGGPGSSRGGLASSPTSRGYGAQSDPHSWRSDQDNGNAGQNSNSNTRPGAGPSSGNPPAYDDVPSYPPEKRGWH